MEREVFRSDPLRGLPAGIIRGFIFGGMILLTGLFLGMDEEMFLPLLGAVMIVSCIISVIICIGKSIEADGNGIYLKNKEYLFAEHDMYMQVHTHYYHALPVTERCIIIDGKEQVKCSFLNGQDAGRLAKIIEDGMRIRYRAAYDGLELHDAEVQTFRIPAAALAEKIDHNTRVMLKTMFWFLTVLFSWMLVSMIIQDQLEDYGLGVLLYMIVVVLILGSVNLSISIKFKKSAQKIPREVGFIGDRCYIDGQVFGGIGVRKVVMTPERGDGKGDMRKLVFYEKNGIIGEYSFGFRSDRNSFPEYGQLVEAVKAHFGDKFAYDFN